MAEFVKVTQIAGRMCKETTECGNCPLVGEDCAFAQNVSDAETLQQVERKVLQWERVHRLQNVWRKHLKTDGEHYGRWYCPKCQQVAPQDYAYCPGCGQKMEGTDDED